MGEPSDDDVPTMTSSADLRGSSDDDAPAESGAFAEDRTIEATPGAVAAIEAGIVAQGGKPPSSQLPVTPPRPRPPAANNQTASGTIETVVRADKSPDPDLAPPSEEDVTAPKRNVPAAVAAHDAKKENEPFEDSTLTATAPAPGGGMPKLGLNPPRSVEIKTLDDVDESEETEVKTLAGEVGEAVRQAKLAARGGGKPLPAAGMPPRASEADATDDSVTAQSPSAQPKSAASPLAPPVRPPRKSDPGLRPITDRGGGASGGAAATRPRQSSSPGLRIAQKNLAPAKERSPAAAAAVAKATAAGGAPASTRAAGLPPAIEGEPLAEDESTTQGLLRPRHPAEALDDSVTAQSPKGISGHLPPAIDGETEGTTKRHRPPADAPDASPADGEQDSVTAHAPGHLTNMLRVIASPGAVDDDDDAGTIDNSDDDAGRTQVMANAPVKPADSSRGRNRGAVAAEQLEPTSESGLRIASSDVAAGERASLGALGVVSGSMPTQERPHSGGMRAPIGSEHAFQSQLAPNMAPRPAFEPAIPSAPSGFSQTGPQLEKKPPYALIVGIVAVISVAIPVVLFLVLNSGPSDVVEPQVTATPSPDPVTRGDGARPRKPAASASAANKRNGGHH